MWTIRWLVGEPLVVGGSGGSFSVTVADPARPGPYSVSPYPPLLCGRTKRSPIGQSREGEDPFVAHLVTNQPHPPTLSLPLGLSASPPTSPRRRRRRRRRGQAAELGAPRPRRRLPCGAAPRRASRARASASYPPLCASGDDSVRLGLCAAHARGSFVATASRSPCPLPRARVPSHPAELGVVPRGNLSCRATDLPSTVLL